MNTFKTTSIFILAIIVIISGGYVTFFSKEIISYLIGLLIIIVGAYGIFDRLVKNKKFMDFLCFGFVTLAITFGVTIFKMILK